MKILDIGKNLEVEDVTNGWAWEQILFDNFCHEPQVGHFMCIFFLTCHQQVILWFLILLGINMLVLQRA